MTAQLYDRSQMQAVFRYCLLCFRWYFFTNPSAGDLSDSVSCDWMIWERERVPGLPAIVIDHVAERRTR